MIVTGLFNIDNRLLHKGTEFYLKNVLHILIRRKSGLFVLITFKAYGAAGR